MSSVGGTDWLGIGHVDARREETGSSRGDGGAILCIGELLWDSLPPGLFLGGAPFNVAWHLHALGARAEMVSRVGADRLGEEALDRLRGYGMSTDLIQVDSKLATGFSKVKLDDRGLPEYEIIEPVAWDALETTRSLRERAADARAIVFGSLAQRGAVTRRTIEEVSRGSALKVFDVNLRPPYDDAQHIHESLQRADVVKMNCDELRRLQSWFDLPQDLAAATAALAEHFRCEVVCVTLGGKGSLLWRRGKLVEHGGYEVEVKDTVGAGDAFLAALIDGLLDEQEDLPLLERANLIGAYVASHSGALPAYRDDVLAQIAGAVSFPNSG